MKRELFLILLLLMGLVGVGYGEVRDRVTNEMIYEKLLQMERRMEKMERRMEEMERRMVQLEKRQAVLETELRVFRKAVDERFEQVDKRFEQVDKRFEQVDRRFEEQNQFLWILASIFTALTAAIIGLLIWDRRTAVKHAVREAEGRLEEKYALGLVRKLLEVLRERARTDKELATILRNFGLL